MKQMGLDINNPFQKPNHFLVKFAACFLLFGLAFRLYFSNFFESLPSDSTLNTNNNTLPPTLDFSPNFGDSPANQTITTQYEKCDIFTGNWVPDPSAPIYTNETCHMIEDHQNCLMNGRPDTGYLYWRWNPQHCELPKFNPKRFLDLMRHKSWAFVGDSILRNHVQSLVCSLSRVEQAVEIYHDKEYKSKTWKFPSNNFTLSVIWAPFLAKADIFEDNDGVATSVIQLHLDKLNPVWTNQYKNYTHILFAGGKWFLKTAMYYQNNTIVGCHNCPGKNITEIGFYKAYRKVLQSAYKFFRNSNHKAEIFFRTITPDHFENGEWNTGGYCNRTKPYKEGEIELNDIDTTMRDIELAEFEKASEKKMNLKLVDTTYVSLLRPDGHPGVYRHYQPYAKDKNAKVQRDCLHWCLPGPVDTWNSLLMETLISG